MTDQEAASGKRCLKVTDAKDLQPSYEPHFFYQPHLVDGTVRESFDLKLEPGALMFTEWRDEKEYPDCIGPSVTFDGSGRIMAYGKLLATVPTGGWMHVQIEAALGKIASRKYSLSIATRGGSPQLFADLPMPGKEFRELHWLGFVSTATADTAFYVNNIQIRRDERPSDAATLPRRKAPAAGTPIKLRLWPDGAPVGDGTYERITPELKIYLPRPDAATGAAVVICPGGGYIRHVVDREGFPIAEWLNAHGIAAILLEYRLPEGRSFVPLLDAHRAIRTTRAKATEWRIDPQRVGISRLLRRRPCGIHRRYAFRCGTGRRRRSHRTMELPSRFHAVGLSRRHHG